MGDLKAKARALVSLSATDGEPVTESLAVWWSLSFCFLMFSLAFSAGVEFPLLFLSSADSFLGGRAGLPGGCSNSFLSNWIGGRFLSSSAVKISALSTKVK